MTAYELLDLLIAELDQLRADNRRLKFELALDQLRADNRRLNLELAAARSQRDSRSSASPLVGVTGRPELWWGGPSNYSDVD
jgi:cell shape-determining protein MreC